MTIDSVKMENRCLNFPDTKFDANYSSDSAFSAQKDSVTLSAGKEFLSEVKNAGLNAAKTVGKFVANEFLHLSTAVCTPFLSCFFLGTGALFGGLSGALAGATGNKAFTRVMQTCGNNEVPLVETKLGYSANKAIMEKTNNKVLAGIGGTIVGLTADSINGAFYLQGTLMKTLNEGFIDVLKQIEGIKEPPTVNPVIVISRPYNN